MVIPVQIFSVWEEFAAFGRYSSEQPT